MTQLLLPLLMPPLLAHPPLLLTLRLTLPRLRKKLPRLLLTLPLPLLLLSNACAAGVRFAGSQIGTKAPVLRPGFFFARATLGQ
ncbi:MAG: hypothetical protein RR311_22595 [Comamonas sp.]